MSNKILLDYFFPITVIEPTPAASTAFLKQALFVAKPKDGGVTTGVITACTTNAAIAALVGTNAAAEAAQLLAAGMSKVYVLPMDDLGLASALVGHESDFWTLIISADFDKDDIGAPGGETVAEVKASLKIEDILYTSKSVGVIGNSTTIIYTDDGTAGSETVGVSGQAINVHMEAGVSTAAQIATAVQNYSPSNALVTVAVDAGDTGDVQNAHTVQSLAGGVDAVNADGLDIGAFKGVVAFSETDDSFLAEQAAIENRSVFHTTSAHKAKNLCYAFGKMLSNASQWRNQQYITMPFGDDVDTLGSANTLFDDKVNFVISDDEFGNRLGLFAVGGKAIVAPYIEKNLQVDFQSAALSYISGNQPAYTLKQASLLEDELKKVIQSYIDREWITAGTVAITLEEDNFVATGAINIAEPKAFWRIFAEMRQTL